MKGLSAQNPWSSPVHPAAVSVRPMAHIGAKVCRTTGAVERQKRRTERNNWPFPFPGTDRSLPVTSGA
ncbi:hypothetical protein Adi01nite_56960 [Amorphoplanes digitatis]|nr:hypothetical protein Adi01nite_56960 [Actinoplanes digitatis]